MNKMDIEALKEEIRLEDEQRLENKNTTVKNIADRVSNNPFFDLMKKHTEEMKELMGQFPNIQDLKNRVFAQDYERQEEYRKALEERNRKEFYISCYELLQKYEFAPEQIPIITNMSDEQLVCLFNKLQDNGYISKDTPVYMCVWIFGGKEKPFALCEQFIDANRDEIEKTTWDFRLFQGELYSYINKNFTYQHFDNTCIKKGYCTQEDVLHRRIKWIKYNIRNKTQPSKKSLLDLLCQLGVSRKYWGDRGYLRNFFVFDNDKKVDFNPQNYDDFTSTSKKSEYHDEIARFISEAKEYRNK